MVNVVENKSVELFKEINEYSKDRSYVHDIPKPLTEDYIFVGKLVNKEHQNIFELTSTLTTQEYNVLEKVYTSLKYKKVGIKFTGEEQGALIKINKEQQIHESFNRALQYLNRRLQMTDREISYWVKAIKDHIEDSLGIEDISESIQLYTFDDGLNECYVFGSTSTDIEIGKVYNVRVRPTKYTEDKYIWPTKKEETYYDLDGVEEIQKENEN